MLPPRVLPNSKPLLGLKRKQSPWLRWSLLLSMVALPLAPALAAKRPPKAAKPPVQLPYDAPATAAKNLPALQISRFTLNNGMRVVVQHDASAPLVAVGVWVDVGSRDEEPGKSGLAHFFEHMMFQGSKRVGKMEHLTAMEAVGADINANTTSDRTWYYQVVPKPALELALWLEAERLAHLQIDGKSVENQRQTVLEERRERYDNRPYAASQLKLIEMAFATWPLQHSTIGEEEDLKRAPVSDFADFFARWYAPKHCILVMAGDVTEAEARTLAQKYLGAVPPRPAAERAALTEPDATAPTSHKAATIGDSKAQTPALHLAWQVPAGLAADVYALDLLADILGGGPSSRLEKVLVRDRTLASTYWVGSHGRKDRDLLHIYAELAEPGRGAVAEARKRIREQIQDLAINGPTAAELEQAKTSFSASWVFGLEGPATRAQLLAQFESWYGDANTLSGLLPGYRAVTAADIRRVARQYLTWDREIELEVVVGKGGFQLTPLKKPAEVMDYDKALARKIKAEADAVAKADADARAKIAAEEKAKADAVAKEAAELAKQKAAPAPVTAPVAAGAEAPAALPRSDSRCSPGPRCPVPVPAVGLPNAATDTTPMGPMPKRVDKSRKKKSGGGR